jgi:hypothetical protein
MGGLEGQLLTNGASYKRSEGRERKEKNAENTKIENEH